MEPICSAVLFVWNIPDGYTPNELDNEFSKFGTIIDTLYNKSKGQAFIEYSSLSESQEAIKHLKSH